MMCLIGIAARCASVRPSVSATFAPLSNVHAARSSTFGSSIGGVGHCTIGPPPAPPTPLVVAPFVALVDPLVALVFVVDAWVPPVPPPPSSFEEHAAIERRRGTVAAKRERMV